MNHARQFLLLDPCLERIGSHPFHYACEILAAAEAFGCSCTLATQRGFIADATWPASWHVHPAFTHSGYSKYTAFGELDRLDARGRKPLRFSWPWSAWHAARRRAARIEAFARDVQPLLGSLQNKDVVLLATASELDAAGLARAIAACRPPAGIAWHVQFHYPLYCGFAGDFAAQQRRLQRVQRLLQTAVATAKPHVLHFHTTTAELAAQYDRLGIGPVSELPYPAQIPGNVRAFTPRSDSEGQTLRVAILGDSRPEKNSHLLAEIVAAASRDPCLAGRLQFAVQSNLGFPANSTVPEHAAVRAALHALKQQPQSLVELLAGPLAADGYAREIQAADVMLLPYDQQRYATRCSGILLEALAAGVVPIVTGGGWMSRQLADPLRLHAESILAASQTLSTQRVTAPRIEALRPFLLPIEPPGSARSSGAVHDVIAVDLTWQASGSACLCEPPMRLALEGIATRPPVVVNADPLQRTVTVLFPIDADAVPNLAGRSDRDGSDKSAGRLRLICAPASGAQSVALESIGIRWIACQRCVPAGAVGVVIDCDGTESQNVVGALREVVRHADHYRGSAIAHAHRVHGSSSGTQVIRRLLP